MRPDLDFPSPDPTLTPPHQLSDYKTSLDTKRDSGNQSGRNSLSSKQYWID